MTTHGVLALSGKAVVLGVAQRLAGIAAIARPAQCTAGTGNVPIPDSSQPVQQGRQAGHAGPRAGLKREQAPSRRQAKALLWAGAGTLSTGRSAATHSPGPVEAPDVAAARRVAAGQ